MMPFIWVLGTKLKNKGCEEVSQCWKVGDSDNQSERGNGIDRPRKNSATTLASSMRRPSIFHIHPLQDPMQRQNARKIRQDWMERKDWRKLWVTSIFRNNDALNEEPKMYWHKTYAFGAVLSTLERTYMKCSAEGLHSRSLTCKLWGFASSKEREKESVGVSCQSIGWGDDPTKWVRQPFYLFRGSENENRHLTILALRPRNRNTF